MNDLPFVLAAQTVNVFKSRSDLSYFLFSVLQQKQKQKMRGNTVNARRTVQVKTKAPWMPPGKTSVLESTYKWEVRLILLLKASFQL